jgi:hypothetical protein
MGSRLRIRTSTPTPPPSSPNPASVVSPVDVDVSMKLEGYMSGSGWWERGDVFGAFEFVFVVFGIF